MERVLVPTADGTTNGLTGSLGTFDPPGPVTGSTSPYAWDAYYHSNEMDSGTVNIVGHYLGANHPINVDFSQSPYNTPQRCATDAGVTFGSVSITAGSPYNISSDGVTGYHETINYTTSAQIPFSIAEDFSYDTGFAGTATGHISMAGGQTGGTIVTNSTIFSHTFNYMPGDANLDGTVDFADLNTVLSYYDKSGQNWSTGDFNGDGVVNLADLNAVLSYYDQKAGEPSAEQILAEHGMTVPEPSGILMLAAMAALAVVRFARIVAVRPGARKA